MGVPLNPSPSTHSERRRRAHPGLRHAVGEVAIISLAILLYFLGRGLVETEVAVAIENAQTLMRFERWLGIFVEPDLQQWVLKGDGTVHLVNAIYMYGHWPVLISTLVWLLWKRSRELPVYRTALLISGLVGMLIFVLFPVAPPRMFPDLGFVDTVTLHSRAYRVLQPPVFTNQYAAMPSLHVGWNLLMGIAIFRNTRHRFWRAFAITMPLAMYFATILTANHLIVDGIAGSIITVSSLVLATWLHHRKQGTSPHSRQRLRAIASSGSEHSISFSSRAKQ